MVDTHGIKKTSCRLYIGDTTRVQPLVVYLHGGGFVYGNFNTADGALRDMTSRIGCHVLVVKYPLAPKYKLGVAIDICKNIISNLQLDIEYDGIVLMGDSAGCNLALNVQYELDIPNVLQGKNTIVGQVLLYPLVEMVYEDSAYRYPSIDKYAQGCLLTKKNLIKMSKSYLPRGTRRDDPRANPIYRDYCHVPPTLIFACGFDPLLDHAIRIYDKLKLVNDSSRLVYYGQITHGYFASFVEYITASIIEIQRYLF
jgi:acetyl esterase